MVAIGFLFWKFLILVSKAVSYQVITNVKKKRLYKAKRVNHGQHTLKKSISKSIFSLMAQRLSRQCLCHIATSLSPWLNIYLATLGKEMVQQWRKLLEQSKFLSVIGVWCCVIGATYWVAHTRYKLHTHTKLQVD